MNKNKEKDWKLKIDEINIGWADMNGYYWRLPTHNLVIHEKDCPLFEGIKSIFTYNGRYNVKPEELPPFVFAVYVMTHMGIA